MRTALPIAAVCALVLSGAGLAAVGKSTELHGKLDRGGHARIKISDGRVDGTRVREYRWTFTRIAVFCAGKRKTAKLPLEGGFSINAQYAGSGPWGLTGTASGDPRDPLYATKVKGRQVGDHRARGWIQVYGSEVALRGGRTAKCDSGRLRWKARD